MDPADAAFIASAYASESHKILEAEAFLAETRYRQQLIAAQALKLIMLKAKEKQQEAHEDVARLHCMTTTATAGSNNRSSVLFESCCFNHLFNVTEPVDQVISQYIFNSRNVFTNIICRQPEHFDLIVTLTL